MVFGTAYGGVVPLMETPARRAGRPGPGGRHRAIIGPEASPTLTGCILGGITSSLFSEV
jgi:hypothetical protein